MKTHQILYFLAIIDNGGIRSASRSLGISQSAIAKALADLEQECACQLLERKTSGGIEITEAGMLLEPYFRSIQLNISWAKSAMSKTKTGDFGVLRVGVTPIVASTILPEVYQWFRSRFKNVQLQFLDGLLTNVTPLLKSAKMDYAIALTIEGDAWDQGHILAKKLDKISHGFIARPEHPIFNSTDKMTEISNYEWLITVDSFDNANDFVNRYIVSNKIVKPKSILLVDTFNCYSMLKNTNCIAVVPNILFKSAPGFSPMKEILFNQNEVKLPDFNLMILKSPSTPNTNAGEFLIHCFKSCIRTYLEGISSELK